MVAAEHARLLEPLEARPEWGRGEAHRVREAGSALERISQVAEHSARLVDGISRSANDQVLATQDLVQAMKRISEVSHAILGEATSLRQDVQALARRSHRLRAITGAEGDPSAPDGDGPPRPASRNGRGSRPLATESLR